MSAGAGVAEDPTHFQTWDSHPIKDKNLEPDLDQFLNNHWESLLLTSIIIITCMGLKLSDSSLSTESCDA